MTTFILILAIIIAGLILYFIIKHKKPITTTTTTTILSTTTSPPILTTTLLPTTTEMIVDCFQLPNYLYFNLTSPIEACRGQIAGKAPYWGDSETFSECAYLFKSEPCIVDGIPIYANPGFYSDQTVGYWREWDGNSFVDEGVCDFVCVQISEQLGYSWNSGIEACSAIKDTYYGDNSDFTLTTRISASDHCLITLSGYYSNGVIWKYTPDGVNFTLSGSC